MANSEILSQEILNWLTEDFFKDIVEKEFHLEPKEYRLKIKSIGPVVGKGENYLSQINRVVLEIMKINGNDSFEFATIVKANLNVNDEFKYSDIFEKEMIMYETVIPRLEEERKCVGKPVKLAPKCYKMVKSPIEILVFEDLTAQNYVVQNRHIGLDLDHSKMVLEKLAEFHAASVMVYEKYGGYNEKLYKSNICSATREMLATSISSTFPRFMEIFEKYEFLKPYHKIMKNWPEKFYHLGREALEPSSFNVLTHADCWTNNLLFTHDKRSNPTNVIMIDYQLCTYGSPIIDLYLFFISSTINELKLQHFDYLVQYYHERLSEFLKELKYTKTLPTLRDIHIDLIKRGFLAVTFCVGLLPLVMLDAEHAMDGLDGVFKDDEKSIEYQRNLYNNPRYLDVLKIMLPFLYKRGALEELCV